MAKKKTREQRLAARRERLKNQKSVKPLQPRISMDLSKIQHGNIVGSREVTTVREMIEITRADGRFWKVLVGDHNPFGRGETLTYPLPSTDGTPGDWMPDRSQESQDHWYYVGLTPYEWMVPGGTVYEVEIMSPGGELNIGVDQANLFQARVPSLRLLRSSPESLPVEWSIIQSVYDHLDKIKQPSLSVEEIDRYRKEADSFSDALICGHLVQAWGKTMSLNIDAQMVRRIQFADIVLPTGLSKVEQLHRENVIMHTFGRHIDHAGGLAKLYICLLAMQASGFKDDRIALRHQVMIQEVSEAWNSLTVDIVDR